MRQILAIDADLINPYIDRALALSRASACIESTLIDCDDLDQLHNVIRALRANP
jgi:Mrp family chromosome partitioning ATPase